MRTDARPTLGDMLFVEDTPCLAAITCEKTGIPLWALIRNAFLREIMSDLLYETSVNAAGAQSRRTGIKAAGTLARGARRNLINRKAFRGDICIMASGSRLVREENRWFNPLCDHFALASPANSVVIEERFGWDWPFPRRFERVLLHAPYQAAGELAGRLNVRRRHRVDARKVVEIVVGRAEDGFGWNPGEARITALANRLAVLTAAVPFMHATYTCLLGGLGARLLLKEEACYGRSAAAVAAARDLGVHVAEYQHGSISSGHDAYNFAAAIGASPVFRRCLPHTFLGYGRWWCDVINAPIDKRVVGNPHREAVLRALPRQAERKEILVLGDGIDTNLYVELVKRLKASSAQSGLTPVFRPHPFERAAVEANVELRSAIEIDTRSDIYQSLSHARAVISEVSTVLFEAIGLVDKILVWDTPKSRFSLPEHPFRRVLTADDILAALGNDMDGHPSSSPQAFWAEDWRETYRSFLAEKGIPATGN